MKIIITILLSAIGVSSSLMASPSLLTPHEAHYNITSGGKGKMIIRIEQQCQHWQLNSFMDAQLIPKNQPNSFDFNVKHAIKEPNDGRAIHFQYHSKIDGRDIVVKKNGKAEIQDDGGLKVTYDDIHGENITEYYDEKVSFPIKAVENMLQTINNDEASLTQFHFDGSDGSPQYMSDMLLSENATLSPLIKGKKTGYRLLTSFFESLSNDGQADFSYIHNISHDGIISDVKMQISDVPMILELDKLRILDKPDC